MASSSSSSAAPGGGARKSGSGTGVTSNNKGGAMSLFSFMPKRQAAVEVADELEAKRRRTAAAAMGKLPTPAKGGSPQASQEQEVPGSKDSTGSGVAAAPLQEQDDPKTPLFGKRSSASPAMASKKDRLLPSEDSDVEMGAAARAEETDPMLRTERKLTQKESRALESELIRSHTPGRAAGSSSAASAIAGNRKSAASGKPKSSSAGPNRVSEGVRAAGIKATSSSSSCAQPPAAASEEAPQEKLAMSEHWKSELAMAQGGIKTTRMKGGEDASAFGLSSSATGGLNAKNLNEYFRKIVDWQSQALYYHQWPSWLLPENIKDKHGRRPDHPDYDQTSLLLPKFTKEMEKDEATKKWLTPMMKQFWQIKKDNFDKVLLFKVGKFYEVFFYDAYLAHDVCDFKWMGKDPRPHVGFPEPVLHLNAAKLVEAGYCSVVVEQIETVEEAQAKKEARKAGGEKGGTVTVERGACEVFTPGTLVHENMMRGRNQDSYFLCVLRQEENTNNFGLCLIDVASGVFRVGYLQDRGEWGQLRTMLAQTQPREVVYHPKHVAPGVIKMLKLMPVRPACTPFDDGIDSISNAKKTVQDEVGKLEANKLTVEVEDVLLNQGSTFALAASFKYLGSILLKNHVLPIAKWSVYDPAVVSQKHMVLDATALDNLEILRRSDGKYEGSLLHFLDKTNTAFGFRLLKRWLCAPLMVPPEIRKRQDVVDVLVDHPDAAQRAKDALKKLPDMERGFVKLCSLGTTLQQRKAVLYQDFIGKRLTDFFKLLDAFDEGQRLLLQLAKDLPPAKELPVRLQQLLTLQEKDDKSSASGALLPDLQALNKEFKTAYVYQTGEGRNMTYRPKVGKSKAYDAIVQQKQDCEGLLENECLLIFLKMSAY
ncbi:unnamed protein product [Amoebophrya sp. A25]|nr:unnamed protein product [Amoebophrya sp. A25]|eukprot:GSA25T00017554001.1